VIDLGTMFKWKVSGLGSKKEKSKSQQQTRLNNEPPTPEQDSNKNNKAKESNKKEKSKDGDASQSPRSRGFRLFQSNGSSNGQTGQPTADCGTGTLSKDAIMSRVGQRLAMPPPATQNPGSPNGFRMSSENLLNCDGDSGMPPPLPPLKPEWRHHMMTAQGLSSPNTSGDQEEEAIPSDSLYGTQESVIQNGAQSWREKQYGSRPKLAEMAHWSSHGYLAKGAEQNNVTDRNSGYVVLKRQGDQMVTMRSNTSSGQPSSLPVQSVQPLVQEPTTAPENKYFSVRGFRDFTNKASDKSVNDESNQKYFSVDAKFLNQHADMKSKLRENLKVSNTQQTFNNNNKPLPDLPHYYQPPAPPVCPPYQRPPPPHRPASDTKPNQPPPIQPKPNIKTTSNLEASKQMSGSVSWLEWTQQLQAYIAWVNSQLRKRPDLKPVHDLRSDLQSGEVLAQLIEIISGEKIAGIIYQPESLQGMRENLDRILQFMASKKIRMHQITSKEILEGNLKAVMRLILALAAHYKPQSVKHHDVSYDNIPDGKAEVVDKPDSHINAGGSKEPESATQPPENRQTTASPASHQPENQTRQSPVALNVKRTPSLNDSHYGTSSNTRLGPDPGEIFNNIERKQRSEIKSNVETQTVQAGPRDSRPAVISPSARGLNNEGFQRTGSGRKLPQIPDRIRCNTLPARKYEDEKEPEDKNESVEEDSTDFRKTKPKAMEFWESMENIERNDFRYNTIHRMSMGRRLLPKPPDAAHGRSQSMDRSESSNEAEKLSLNSSFSGPTSLPLNKSDGDSSVPPSPRIFHKIPPDGASLQSHNSEGNEINLDCRGEVEGSSNNNSPPTSVIQGLSEDGQNVWEVSKQNPAYDWVRGTFDRSSDSGRRKWGLPSPVTSVGTEYNINDDLIKKVSTAKDQKDKIVPYDVLLEDLSQAKRQLLELHNLECMNLEGSKLGLQTRLAEQESNISNLKQTLLRTTLAKQSLESEKKELMRKIEDINENSNNDDVRRVDKAVYNEELQVARDAIANLRSSFSDSDPNQHILDTLEQCISVIVEKLVDGSKPGSRMSNSEHSDIGSPTTVTKVVYFTPRSVTPFMSTIPKAVGKISLRDFKTLFDRPGFYRYHFKTMDKEFGMVKEEISDDDKVLPGVEGKIVVWVEEE